MNFYQVLYMIGLFVARKYTRLAEEKGFHQAAKNLRKQGVPFAEAHLILLGRYPRHVE
jgi:hypothetical protein